uniref:Coiled-coil-helix-coiled-coil-helix domain containing 3 n=1 Tax=Apteryx owenii TaxID=8824 RepID=A0A8B9Q475_APTOW
MGGAGSSTRRVTFEADENENITVVKGVRLSDNVIDRMKEPSSPSGRLHSQHRSASGAVNDEELKKRIAEELALERARRDSEAQKRSFLSGSNIYLYRNEELYVKEGFLLVSFLLFPQASAGWCWSTEVACTVPGGAMAHELQRCESPPSQQDASAPPSSAKKSAQLGGPACMFWDSMAVRS